MRHVSGVIPGAGSVRGLLSAIVVGVLSGAARWTYECRLVVALVPDPQSPIWIMVSGITSLFIAVTVTLAAWLAIRGCAARAVWMRVALAMPLVLRLAWYSSGFGTLARMRAALLDAADPATAAERLRELANFTGGPGYEIDNRVARHPNTPADVLRALHGRPDQVGTEMCLAENPNTPDDVLRALARRDDQWAALVHTALRRNPRHAEVFGDHDPGAAPAPPVPARPESEETSGTDGATSGRSTR
ncbi:MAG: hypothetical protein ACKOTB_13390 [Planctomycetia bacterium]